MENCKRIQINPQRLARSKWIENKRIIVGALIKKFTPQEHRIGLSLKDKN